MQDYQWRNRYVRLCYHCGQHHDLRYSCTVEQAAQARAADLVDPVCDRHRNPLPGSPALRDAASCPACAARRGIIAAAVREPLSTQTQRMLGLIGETPAN